MLRKRPRFVLVHLVFVLGVTACQSGTPSGTKTLEVEFALGTGFDTVLISGFQTFIDGPDGGSLSFPAVAAYEKTTGGHRYTAEAKDFDGDDAGEFGVTFTTNPFSGTSPAASETPA